jgi:hypothetical protein
VRRGLLLNYLTIGYNALEAVVALIAGPLAGSGALVGFGIDSGWVNETTVHWLRTPIHERRHAFEPRR